MGNNLGGYLGATYLTQIAGLQPQAMANVMLGIGLSSMAFAIGLGRFSDYLFRKTQSLIKSYDVVLVTVLFIGAAAFALTTIIASPVFSVLLLGLGLVLNACLLQC